MKIMLGLGLAMSLACISAADSPAEYQYYFGGRVDADPMLATHFDKAVRHCEPEASDPYRGSPDHVSWLYTIAMRNCLARYNFIDRGSYAALPITLGLDHIIDR
jgi:hypothetical protein